MSEQEGCTWEDCQESAIVTRFADDGEPWAKLCDQHARELERAETDVSGSPGRMLRAWIKAQGGAKKAAKRMLR